MGSRIINLIALTPLLIGQDAKAMSQGQYLKMLEREIQRINKKIDQKILKGLPYAKEARDHKLLVQKVRFHTRRSFGERLIHLFFRKDIIHA